MNRIYFLILLAILFACSDTEFSAGIENRLTAVIDMAPETYNQKVDFTSDDDVLGCPDHDKFYIDELADGSDDNKYYTIRIEAKDLYKSQNNCNESSWYYTEQELVQHELIITAYADEIKRNMYLESSIYFDHPNYPTSPIVAKYKLIQDEDGQDNDIDGDGDGEGIEYFGSTVELEIIDLNLNNNTVSGMLNATLYRGTPVNDPGAFMGVDNIPNLDLYNPYIGDVLGDIDGDGIIDYHLTDSIRIENCIFQNITVINNMTS